MEMALNKDKRETFYLTDGIFFWPIVRTVQWSECGGWVRNCFTLDVWTPGGGGNPGL